MAVIFHFPSSGAIVSSARCSLTRRWICPQWPIQPATRLGNVNTKGLQTEVHEFDYKAVGLCLRK